MLHSDFDVYSTPRKARVEIIPLIDVIFFLLATFVLFTLSLQKTRDLDLELPAATETSGAPDFTTLFVQASESGTYYVKQGTTGMAELISAAELRPRLENYRDSTSTPRVFIRSDRKAKFADGIYALDEVRLAGIKQVSVETVPSAPGS
jgi:biopolymer transport protein ExbD